MAMCMVGRGIGENAYYIPGPVGEKKEGICVLPGIEKESFPALSEKRD